ncbi:nucleotidyltransferase family protein [Candidatus Bathyarchaeota archaeon]|jgi:hypothetical protein|nr:nucleotidyltransferase family protein [Candidatus Bathyarchaeota archaeon]
MEFVRRENEILRMLKRLVEERLDFVVVGGYAVSGLARHRFSVDCDIVVSKRELEKFEEVLKKEGFKRHVRKTGFDEVYAGEFISYKKEVGELPVTIDFLVGSLVCRATEASWSFDYIKNHSIEVAITGIEILASCRIPEKELLIAFKIHSARRTDIRDIIMMREGSDLEKVLKHLRKGKMDALKTQINKIIEALNDKNLVDSLKGVFTLTVDVRKQIESTRQDIESILKSIR